MQEWAMPCGIISALVSDRWMFAQYGAAFVTGSAARGWHLEVVDERPTDPFVRPVGAYSSIVRFSHRGPNGPTAGRSSARRRHALLVDRHGTLMDAGCVIRVGPALGAGRTFLLDENEVTLVEPELVRDFVAKADLSGDRVERSGRRVIVPYDRTGSMIDPAAWPGFAAWANRNEDILRDRSQFRKADRFWRTIDAVPAIWSECPKLLMPELSNEPRAVLDRTGSIPAHSIYAIWSREWPVEILQKVLNAGLLALTAAAEAPRLSHGWVRFYKRFLALTPLPAWNTLSPEERGDLLGARGDFDRRFELLFGFPVGKPPIE
jgi:hypothetical protein